MVSWPRDFKKLPAFEGTQTVSREALQQMAMTVEAALKILHLPQNNSEYDVVRMLLVARGHMVAAGAKYGDLAIHNDCPKGSGEICMICRTCREQDS